LALLKISATVFECPVAIMAIKKNNNNLKNEKT